MFMAKMEGEKTISGDVEESIYEEYDQRTRELKLSKKKLVRSLVLWWLSMDEDAQKHIYHLEDKFSVEKLVETKLKQFMASPQGQQFLVHYFEEIGQGLAKRKK